MKISGFANSEIAAELKAAVLFREYDNPVQKIADMLGLKNRTVYDYFDGNIKISLRHVVFVLYRTAVAIDDRLAQYDLRGLAVAGYALELAPILDKHITRHAQPYLT